MNPGRKKVIKKFLNSFGGVSPSRCSFPKLPVASKSKDSVFGCCGNMCQHLPDTLSGNEILVIDNPIKLALHVSCKTALVEGLKRKGFYYHTAKDGTGLCFDPDKAANKPPYSVLVDTILDACYVSPKDLGTQNPCWIIHVADIGCRFPLNSATSTDSLFDQCQSMKQTGVVVEILQLDIAFVTKIPPDLLIQASCKRKPDNDLLSVFRKSHIKIFPLHKLPYLGDGKMKNNQLKGTIQIKKYRWKEDQGDDIDISGGDHCSITECYISKAMTSTNQREEIIISSSTVHSLKAYSTIAHAQLQQRSKFPLSDRAMYGIGNRSFDVLQTMICNARSVLDHSFDIVNSRGVDFRIEVSIRPPDDDPIRRNGHMTDFLLIACVAVKEFCEKKYSPELVTFHTRSVQTQALKLLSDITSMIGIRRSNTFQNFYGNQKATDWLRCHLSQMLITIGMSPSFDVKYINQWIADNNRFDPHNHLISASQVPPSISLSNILEGMLSSLEHHLNRLGFSKHGTAFIKEFVKGAPDSEARCYYMELSLKDKHLLSNTLWTDIIPNMSAFLSKERNQVDGSNDDTNSNLIGISPQEESSEMFEHNEDYSPTWWRDQPIISHASLTNMMQTSSVPKHPLALGIFSLAKMGSLWHPNRIGYNQILCNYVLLCHNSTFLDHGLVTEKTTEKLLRDCISGNQLTREQFKKVTMGLSVPGSSNRNQSVSAYHKLMCRHYQFPMSDLEVTYESRRKRIERNKILNEALCSDIAIRTSFDTGKSTFFRVADNTTVHVPHKNNVLANYDNPQFRVNSHGMNLYALISEIFNSNGELCIRENLHNDFCAVNSIKSVMLSSHGTTDEGFKDIDNMAHLEKIHNIVLLANYSNLKSLMLSRQYNPEIVISMASYHFNCNILFFNKKLHMATLFHHQKDCLIIYRDVGFNVRPVIPTYTIIHREDHVYEWVDFKEPAPREWNQSTKTSSAANPGNYSPIGGRITGQVNLSSIPVRRRGKPGQSLHMAICKMLLEVDDSYIDNNEPINDPLCLIHFLKELSHSRKERKEFDGFHQSTVQNCPELNMPLKMLLHHIVTIKLDNLKHHILCPLICLKYQNLILGVLQYDESKTKMTYFYGYNGRSENVECKSHQGYRQLTDRSQTVYLYAGPKASQYFMPQEIIQNRLLHLDSMTGKYSHLGPHAFWHYMGIMKMACNIETVCSEQELREYNFRPESPSNTITPIHVVTNSNKIKYMSHNGIELPALILLFPQNNQDQRWDACIVHNPCHDSTTMVGLLSSFLERAPESGEYICHALKGRDIVGCESGFLFLFYTYIGSRCRTLLGFKTAMGILDNTRDLKGKVRLWLHFIAKHGKIPHIPWMSSTTLSNINANNQVILTNVTNEINPPSSSPPSSSNEGIANENNPKQKNKKRKLEWSTTQTSIGRSGKCVASSHYKGGGFVQLNSNSLSPGIMNSGNLCYMIVSVQLLYGIQPIRKSFLERNFPQSCTPTYKPHDAELQKERIIISNALHRVFLNINKKQENVSITNFRKEILSTSTFGEFNNMQQHDAHHFLVKFLHILTFGISNLEQDQNHVSKLFQSSVVSSIQCFSCGTKNWNTTDRSMILELPIFGTSLKHCLAKFLEREIISNGWICSKCKTERPATKTLHIEKRKILVLTLKRYNQSGNKIETLIDFPLELLEVPTRDPTSINIGKPSHSRYKLLGLINHHGSSGSGHYTLVLRKNYLNHMWVNYNDSCVSATSKESVVSGEAYILVYCLEECLGDIIN